MLLFDIIPSHFLPKDNIRAMMIVWRIEGKIIRTVLCCIVYHNNVLNMQTHFLQVTLTVTILHNKHLFNAVGRSCLNYITLHYKRQIQKRPTAKYVVHLKCTVN